jgi:hypothetical protein
MWVSLLALVNTCIPLFWIVSILSWAASLFWPILLRVASYGKLERDNPINGNDYHTIQLISWTLRRSSGFRIMYCVALSWSVFALLVHHRTVYTLLVCVHVTQRWAESLWLHRFSDSRMTVLGLLMGVAFYAVVPLNQGVTYNDRAAESFSNRIVLVVAGERKTFHIY